MTDERWAVPGWSEPAPAPKIVITPSAAPSPPELPASRPWRVIIGVGVAVVGVCVAVVAVLGRRDHPTTPPPSEASNALNAAAARSLTQGSFTMRLSGPGADPAVAGVTEFEAPDRAHSLPNDRELGAEQLVIGTKVLLPERNGRWIAYDEADPHYFDGLKQMLAFLSTTTSVSDAGDHYRVTYEFSSLAVESDVTVSNGLVVRVVSTTPQGPSVIEYFNYGTTVVDNPPASMVDDGSKAPPCLPNGQQDPVVACTNSASS
jgi:hypothetical protein